MAHEPGSLAGVENVETEHGSVSIAENTTELDTVTTGVHGLRTVMVNLYSITENDGSWVLIDSGLPGSKGKVEKWIGKIHGTSKPQALLLTHGHFDHVGSVEELAREWGIPVYAHSEELPYVTGQRDYPPPDPSVGGGAMSVLAPYLPKKKVNLTGLVSPLPVGGMVPGLPSWQWFHTPGHTEGHVSFFRESDRTLIAGDAVSTTKPESVWAIITHKSELHGPPAYLTTDWVAAKKSVQKLAGLNPQYVAAGHGTPIQGDAASEGLAKLAANFDELAVPKHHKY